MDFFGSEAEYGKVKEGSRLHTKWNPLFLNLHGSISNKQKIGPETRHRTWIGDINKLIKNLDYSSTSEDSIEVNKCTVFHSSFLIN